MILTFVLVGLEHGINHVIAQKASTRLCLAPLVGNTLQIVLLKPSLQINVVFNESDIRFEPVIDDIFEPQGGYAPSIDGTLTMVGLSEFLEFIQSPLHATPVMYDGEMVLLDHFHEFCQSFDFSLLLHKLTDKYGDLHEMIRPFLPYFNKNQP